MTETNFVVEKCWKFHNYNIAYIYNSHRSSACENILQVDFSRFYVSYETAKFSCLFYSLVHVVQ